MPEFTRRSALTAALITGVGASVQQQANGEETPQTDQDFVMAAGMTKEEAECWKKVAEAAGAFFKLPEQHPMDRQEVASAIHIVQNKLLARPTYRKYLKLAKEARPAGD